MKSMIIEEAKGQERKDEYPCLKRLRGSSLIVLFTAKGKGVGMTDNDEGVRIAPGEYKEIWNEDMYIPLPKGSIVQFVN